MIKNDETYKNHTEDLLISQRETLKACYHSCRGIAVPISLVTLFFLAICLFPIFVNFSVLRLLICIGILTPLLIIFVSVLPRCLYYARLLRLLSDVYAGKSEKREILCTRAVPAFLPISRGHGILAAVTLETADGEKYTYVLPKEVIEYEEANTAISVELEGQRLLLTCYADSALVQYIEGVSPDKP